MGSFREQEDRRQGFLLPPSPSDWLPEGHLAWFIIDAVEQLNIDALLDEYRVGGKGEKAYPPRVMLALLIYGYCTGTFASRKIAAQIEDSVAFRVIAAGLSPAHRTICRFREENLDEFQRLFVQVVQLAQEAGLVKMGTIAVDGSKVKANASKHKAMSYDRMLMEEKKLRSEIRKLTQAAREQDDIDDQTFGPDFRGDELPQELSNRKPRLQTIQSAKKTGDVWSPSEMRTARSTAVFVRCRAGSGCRRSSAGRRGASPARRRDGPPSGASLACSPAWESTHSCATRSARSWPRSAIPAACWHAPPRAMRSRARCCCAI